MSRWVRIQADVFEHAVFTPEPFTEGQAWVWLISKAAWRDTTHRVGPVVVDVPVGSIFLTLREMQSAWRWKSDKRVRSFLARLELAEMITTKTDAGKTQVSICNYSRYQEVGRTEDAERTQDGRKTDALKTPIHQNTSISDANASSSPEPAKAAPVQSSPTVIELPCVSGSPYPVSEDDVSEWQEAFPGVDVRQQLLVMRTWLNANETRRKTRKGMKRFIVSWLERQQNNGHAPSPQHRSTAPPIRPAEPRNAGERALLKLQRQHDERTDPDTGYDAIGFGGGQASSAGLSGDFAGPTLLFSRTG